MNVDLASLAAEMAAENREPAEGEFRVSDVSRMTGLGKDAARKRVGKWVAEGRAEPVGARKVRDEAGRWQRVQHWRMRDRGEETATD